MTRKQSSEPGTGAGTKATAKADTRAGTKSAGKAGGDAPAPAAATDDPVIRLMPVRNRRCPVCGLAAVQRFRPFCSAACAERDLGRWLSDAYRVPGDEAPLADDEA